MGNNNYSNWLIIFLDNGNFELVYWIWLCKNNWGVYTVLSILGYEWTGQSLRELCVKELTAKTHSKLKTTTRKAKACEPYECYYTVGYTPQGIKANPRPQLTIKGRWLEQLGFYTGQPVIVKIEHNKLIIELAIKI